MMVITFFFSYLILFTVLMIIHYTFPRVIPFFEITLNEPIPIQDEYLSTFKLRKLKFIFNTLLMVFAAFSTFYILQNYIKITFVHHFLLIFTFFLMFASCIAVFANIIFIASWIRTKYFGRDPKCDISDIASFYE